MAAITTASGLVYEDTVPGTGALRRQAIWSQCTTPAGWKSAASLIQARIATIPFSSPGSRSCHQGLGRGCSGHVDRRYSQADHPGGAGVWRTRRWRRDSTECDADFRSRTARSAMSRRRSVGQMAPAGGCCTQEAGAEGKPEPPAESVAKGVEPAVAPAPVAAEPADPVPVSGRLGLAGSATAANRKRPVRGGASTRRPRPQEAPAAASRKMRPSHCGHCAQVSGRRVQRKLSVHRSQGGGTESIGSGLGGLGAR